MEKQILYLACTRPATKLGVPFEGFMLNFCGSFLIGIWMGSPLYWTIFGVLHFPMRILTSIDHNFFRIGRLWLETKGRSLRMDHWGGSLLSPLPVGVPRKAKEICGCV